MMKTQLKTVLSSVQPALSKPMPFDDLLKLFGEKDRQSLIRQLELHEAKAGREVADLWRQLACILMTLAPHRAKLGGQQTLLFFIADGQYRKQVYALNAPGDGTTGVYTPNILAEAIKAGILAKTRPSDVATEYRIASSDDSLMIEPLDGKTPNPATYFKDMTGWNRKALRITLPASPTEDQIEAVKAMCALAATAWVGKK